MKFDRYIDPGHSWVKVSRKLCQKLNILPFISSYSYERGEYIYLEEDCDFGTFFDAMQRVDSVVELKPHYSNKSSKIRSYNSYQAR